jgi:hypothetical protein
MSRYFDDKQRINTVYIVPDSYPGKDNRLTAYGLYSTETFELNFSFPPAITDAILGGFLQ